MNSVETKSNLINRIQSVDFLRGIVMIIMAIDHVRVYSGMPAGGPTAGIFFTRWITHYCAPAFVFFAGTSAFLYFQKTKNTGDVIKFLITRGLLLVFLELTVVRFFWMFNLNFASFTFTGVIWTLGWCLVFLALFVKLRPVTIGIFGLLIIFFQQIFSYIPEIFPMSLHDSVAKVWGFFYPVAVRSNANILSSTSGMGTTFGFSIFYVIIPWIGVMMTGYAFGRILLLDPVKRQKVCVGLGLGAIILFIIAGTIIILRSEPDTSTPIIFKLLGQAKYPPSQLFILMTVGPLIALVPWAEKAKGWLVQAITMIGRVPMFYYLVHILLIHLSALVVNQILFGTIHQDWYESAPFVGIAENLRWGLPLLYVVWVIDVVILYFICKWYATFKARHPEKVWLKYL